MHLDKIRRDALALWLRGVRLPLTATEAVLMRGEDTPTWGPALAFEKAEAHVKGVVGRLTRDDTLIGMANLQRAEVAKREEALSTWAEAEARRDDVRQEAAAQQRELDERRAQVAQATEAREAKIEEARVRSERQVAQRTAAKRAATRKKAAERKDAIDAAETEADAQRLRKEAAALRAKEQAVQAQGAVLDLDRAVTAKKAARKAG